MRFIVSLFFLVGLAVAKTETVLLYNGKTLAAQSVYFDSEGQLWVDGQSYKQSQIAQWLTSQPATVGAVHGVRFRDGQLSLGTLVSADAKSISLRAEPLGRVVNILRSDIAEIIFLRREHKASRANLPEGSDMGWLLRPGVDPVPCKLDGVGGAKVAVSTKIGQFHLPLDTLGRYVMTHWNKAPNTDVVGWEIGLTDGSVFHGKLSGGEGKVTLQVSDQSAFTVPLNAIRYVRNREGVDWLPLWKSGKALVDGLGQSELSDTALGVYLSLGEALTLPASVVGELRLNGFMTHNYPGRLIISQSGKELDSRSLSGDLSTLTLPIREVGVLTFRIESSQPYATAILSDLAIFGKDTQ